MLGKSFKYVSNNPLLSTVFGTLIASVLLAWKWEDTKAIFGWAGGLLAGGLTWFEAPAQLTHFDVLVFAAALIALVLYVRRLSRRLHRLDMTAIRGPMGKLVDDITWLQNHARESSGTKSDDDPKVTEGFTPNHLQLIAGKTLVDRYPKRLQLADLAAAMKMITGMPMAFPSQGEIARQMEDMERNGVAFIIQPEGPMTYYGLTRHGRDFMLEALKQNPPQPAPKPARPAVRYFADDDKN